MGLNYESILDTVRNKAQFKSKPRGKSILEVCDFQTQIKHNEVLFENERRSTPWGYLAAELCWYLSRDRSVEFISKAAPFWLSLTDQENNVNSNYGVLTFCTHSWAWMINSFKSDADTRQGILHYNNQEHMKLGVKDFPCTMYNSFRIRDGVLYMTARMRSCDVIRGLTFDAPWFSFLHHQVCYALKEADKVKFKDLLVAPYVTFSADSLHLYEEHFKLSGEMLDHRFSYSGIDMAQAVDSDGSAYAGFCTGQVSGVKCEPISVFEIFVAKCFERGDK